MVNNLFLFSKGYVVKRGFDHKIIDNNLLAKPIDNLKDLFAKASNPQP